MSKHLIVIGGGAAGFFCAVNAVAANPSLRVTILEKSGKLLTKVRVSGGGRCNVTHACSSIVEMVRSYPRGQNFLKQSFHQFFTSDTIQWFAHRNVALKTEPDGRMFPVTDSSETIINCLLNEADRYHVEVKLKCDVINISILKSETQTGFRVHLADGSFLNSDYVCIACGGFPKLQQYQWIQALGHRVLPPVPSLFTFNVPDGNLEPLMGISVEQARVKIKGTNFIQTGPLLITHWGFSGPAILKLSAYAARELAEIGYNFTIQINWTGDTNESALLEQLKRIRQLHNKRDIGNRNPFGLPARLWEYHLNACEINPGWNWADLPAKQQNQLARNLCTQEFLVKGKTTFKEEFVTAGGILLNEISPATMESRIVPGLFFAGEIMDVDGITGGFNFQHAWTSGYVAAMAIAEKLH